MDPQLADPSVRTPAQVAPLGALHFGCAGVASQEPGDLDRILMLTVLNEAYAALKAMVFENINESTVTEIKDVIERAVLFFEPRITLESIDVETDDANEGRVNVKLNYLVRTTNTRSNIVYPFYFIEGSQVRM